MKNFIILITLTIVFSFNTYANYNGVAHYAPESCASSALSSVAYICDKLTQYFPGIGGCDFSANHCATGSQEIFTGVDLKPIFMIRGGRLPLWTQMGGRGSLMSQGALCSLRELSISPPVSAKAKASTLLGNATVKSLVSVTNFNPSDRSATGYHTMKACLPVVGCLDGFQQKFTLSEKITRYPYYAPKVGHYTVKSTNGLKLKSNGLDQKLSITLPAITVSTPYGAVSANPEFYFNRNLNAQMSPFWSHGKESKMYRATVYVEGSPINTILEDIYGRNPGLAKTQNFGGKGWTSVIGLGSRDANPKNEAWYQSGTFPALTSRPDLDFNTARSEQEKIPNLSLGASAAIEYSPTDLLPEAIMNNNYITTSFKVIVKPIIGANYTSQLNFVSRETPKRLTASRQEFQIFSGTSVASTFALVTGIDLVINLHVPLPIVDDIDIDLVNIHPRYTAAEMIRDQHKAGDRSAYLESSLITKIPQRRMTLFNTFGKYVNPSRAQQYINQCLSLPEVTNPAPEKPSYEPGNPEDLTKFVEYPCNICVGYKGYEYDDPETGKHVVIKSHLETMTPSDYNNMPSNLRWSCDSLREVGCYDKCSYNVKTDQLTVIESAVEMTGPNTKICR